MIAIPNDIEIKASLVLSNMGIPNTSTNRYFIELALVKERLRCLSNLASESEHLHDERDTDVIEAIADAIRRGN